MGFPGCVIGARNAFRKMQGRIQGAQFLALAGRPAPPVTPEEHRLPGQEEP